MFVSSEGYVDVREDELIDLLGTEMSATHEEVRDFLRDGPLLRLTFTRPDGIEEQREGYYLPCSTLALA
jgi:hypothetical protein